MDVVVGVKVGVYGEEVWEDEWVDSVVCCGGVGGWVVEGLYEVEGVRLVGLEGGEGGLGWGGGGWVGVGWLGIILELVE